MSQRSRLLIYERKEVVLLGILSVLVAIFAFTFGIHLGKRVPPKGKPASVEGSEVGHVNQISDQAPTRAEAQEKVAAAPGAAAEMMDEAIQAEVAAVGLKLDKPVQVELPKKTVAEKKAHAPAPVEKKVSAPVASAVALTATLATGLARGAPQGAFTLQIFAFPVSDSASLQKGLAKLTAAGLQPWVRQVEIPSKGSWYRVQQGGFATLEAAEKAGAQLKSAGKIDGFVVTRIAAQPAHEASGEQHE